MSNKKDKKISFQDKIQQILGKMSLNDKIIKMASFLAGLNGCGAEEENENVFYINDFQNTIEAAATFNIEVIKKNAESILESYGRQHGSFGAAAVFNINMSSDKLLWESIETYSEDAYLITCISLCLLDAAKEAGSKSKSWTVPQYSCFFQDYAKQFKDDYYVMLKSVLRETKYFLINYIGPTQMSKPAIKTFSTILFKELNFRGNVLFKLCPEKHTINDDVLLDIMEYSVNAGCLLICSNAENLLKEAMKQKAIKEKSVDKLLAKLLANMQGEANGTAEPGDKIQNNDEQAIAEESIVLLKNDGLLPLVAESAKKIAVIGPFADFGEHNGNEDADRMKTILTGISSTNHKAETIFAQGCEAYDDNTDKKGSLLSEALWAAQQADIIILAVGCDSAMCENKRLPENQETLIEEICGIGKPVILLNFSKAWVDLSEADEMCNCVLQCWKQYKTGGETIAKIIFGECNPSGRLPVTFYKDLDYGLVGKNTNTQHSGNIYSKEKVLYPFGYGLSYSLVEYYRIYLSESKIKKGEDITVTIFVKNKGRYSTKETIQAYLKDEQASVSVPRWRLAAFEKTLLLPGEEKKISMKITSEMMALINSDGESKIESGRFSIYVGGGQPDDTTAELYNRDCLHIGFLVE